MPYRSRISLTDEYEEKLNRIKTDLGCDDKEAFIELIDLYLLESPRHISMIRSSIINRMSKGIGYEFAAQLRALMSLIEYTLRKIRYIK